jgi:large subunit ribosomal protein L18e
MPRPTGPTDPNLLKLIREMRKGGHADIAKLLSKPRRQKLSVNVARIGKFPSDKVAVAGKVLGTGEIKKPVTVYAWQFSKEAKKKIEGAKGTCMPLSDLAHTKDKIMVIK